MFCGLIILLFISSFGYLPLFPFAQFAIIIFIALSILDISLLFNAGNNLSGNRKHPKILSLGDESTIHLNLQNEGKQTLYLTVIDELPFQLQIRNFSKKIAIKADNEEQLSYSIRPVQRGAYEFGNIILFARSILGLTERKVSIEAQEEVPVYPSILQMKNFELKAFDRISTQQGIKRIRRIGHSYEFEQIKNYVRGDDYRSINWKASSRKAALMVNQYEDERAQQIYCIIDKSRVMQMPFNNLSLMDYAINTTLVISNIALQKYDRAGLITFSDKIGSSIKADNRTTQLNKILSALYNEKQRPLEANYELLYYITRRLIRGRSLLLLFTNFESKYAMERVLPVLRKINKFHLLVVVFFENTEIRAYAEQEVNDLKGIYYQTVAQNFLNEKVQLVQQLQQYGIQSILTKPEDLSINTINKYLELKSRGLI